MTVSMYGISAPVFIRLLKNLSALLDKGQAYADAKKIASGVFPESRLIADMHPLSKQVQIATDQAKGSMARLAGVDIPKYEDNEQTIGDIKARIAKTVSFIESFKPEQINGTEARDIALTMGGKDLKFTGEAYLLEFVLPNFYFHVVTAYNILRQNGVDIGKRDFLAK